MDEKVSRILCCEYALRIAKMRCGFEYDTLYIPLNFYKNIFKLGEPTISFLLGICDEYDKLKEAEKNYTAAFDKFHSNFDNIKTKND